MLVKNAMHLRKRLLNTIKNVLHITTSQAIILILLPKR
jgi:hypothetical protein